MTDSNIEAEATRIMQRLDDLREEWDRLDALCSQADKQNLITASIERLKQQLKERTGEEY